MQYLLLDSLKGVSLALSSGRFEIMVLGSDDGSVNGITVVKRVCKEGRTCGYSRSHRDQSTMTAMLIPSKGRSLMT